MNDIIMGRMVSGQIGKIPSLEKRIKLLEKKIESLQSLVEIPTPKKRGRPRLAKND